MNTDNLNLVALALYGGSRVTPASTSETGRVEFDVELTPEAETLIAQSRLGGLQVDYLRHVASLEEMRSLVRRAKARR